MYALLESCRRKLKNIKKPFRKKRPYNIEFEYQKLVIEEKIHSPYFIFVRNHGTLTDTDILKLFGLETYVLSPFAPDSSSYAVLADDGIWTMLADNWSYQLWHEESTHKVIEEIATHYDVFTCFVGDSCESFSFIYYHNGKLIRKYVVEDPDYNGGIVFENIGEALEMESEILKNDDILKTVLSLAQSIGIKTDYTEEELRVYISPNDTQHIP